MTNLLYGSTIFLQNESSQSSQILPFTRETETNYLSVYIPIYNLQLCIPGNLEKNVVSVNFDIQKLKEN